MSLLHKNGILKEYRRQHREELAAQEAADAAAAAANAATGEENNGDADDEFPDVAAFQVVGTSTTASPIHARPSPNSATSRIGDGGGNSSTRAKSKSAENGSGAPTALLSSSSTPPPLQIQTSFKGGDGSSSRRSSSGGPLKGGADERQPSTSPGGHHSEHGANDEDSDEFVDLDHFSPPLAPTSNVPRSGNGPTASPPTANSTQPVQRSRSDLTVEDEHGAGRTTQLHSPATDPTVSPTTLTTGVETFLSATDAADGAHSTYGNYTVNPSLRVTGAGATTSSSTNVHNNNNNNTNNDVSRVISSTSGLPLSPSASKPHSPTSLLAPPLVVRIGQLTPAQAAPANASGTDGHGQATLDVSCSSSSSSSSSTEASEHGDETQHEHHHHHHPEPNHPQLEQPVFEDQPSMMSEEAVSKLHLNNTTNSLEGETIVTGGSPGVLRADVSDTMLQPPTSILSEPSTLDTTTANLTALRNRSNAMRAMERAGKPGRTAPTAQVPPSTATATAAAADNDANNDDDDDVFSRVSATEVLDGANTSLNLAPSLVDTRVALGPSHLLSFSGTARTLPRNGEDEDVDVDPSGTFTDATARGQLMAKPITFYEAYIDLIRDMKKETLAAEEEVCQRGSKHPSTHKNAAQQQQQGTASEPQQPQKTKKKSLLASLFSCCSPSESDVRTRQPRDYAQTSADLDQYGTESVHTTPAPSKEVSAEQVERDLQVVRFLKSTPLSLQNTTHRRMLYTMLNVLTGQVPWPHLRSGSGTSPTLTPPSSTRAARWELIGFQGSNPATDVRATGVLGVLQLLYLLDYYPSFTKRMWDLCQNPSGARCFSEVASPDRQRPRAAIANELPFVLVCFNFTALVLDAAGQHLLDDEIRKARRSHLRSVVPVARPNKPEAHLVDSPGMFVCCEALVGALELFAESWFARRRGEDGSSAEVSSPLPPMNRPSIALFGDMKAKLRGRILKKGGALLLQDAVEKVRAEALLAMSEERERERERERARERYR